MRGSRAIALLLVISSVSPAFCQPIFHSHIIAAGPAPQEAEPTQRIARLIKKLDTPSDMRRHAAVLELLDLGPALEAQLRGAARKAQASPHNGWEVLPGKVYTSILKPEAVPPRFGGNELDVVISHLETRRHLMGSVLTLDYIQTPLLEVLRDFGAQAETQVSFGSWYNLVPVESLNTNLVTVRISRRPYWDAIRALAEQTGVKTSLYNGQNLLTFEKYGFLGETNKAEKLRSYSQIRGPFQIRPVSIETRRKLNFDGGKTSRTTTVTLLVQAEPKLSNSRPYAQALVKKCLDGRGNDLVAGTNRTFCSVDSSSCAVWSIPIEVREPAADRRIKELSGELRVAVGISQRYLSLTNVMSGKRASREFDGARLTIEKAGVADNYYELQIALSAPEGSPWTLSLGKGEQPNVQLWDENLNGIVRPDVFVSPNETSHKDGRQIVTWQFSCNRTPAMLTWLTPPETRWVTVPFEFRDLQVP